MDESSLNIVRSLSSDRQIQAFARLLGDWLGEDLAQSQNPDFLFTESRARALLISANLLDGPALSDFNNMMQNEGVKRIVLCDLLGDSGMASNAQVSTLLTTTQVVAQNAVTEESTEATSWLALILGGYAWKSGYPLNQLDPSSPPGAYTPAGQVLRRSASFIRKQIQRSATERDRILRELAAPPSSIPTLEELSPGSDQIAPLPPHYRPPVPENYPEMTNETIQIDPDLAESPPSIETGSPLVISADDIGQEATSETEVVHMPQITINRDQVVQESQTPPSPLPSSAVVVPTDQASQSRPSLTVALRQMLGHEQLASTKLRIQVQQYPDGPGLFGLQVRVSCKGVKSYVAGTTDRDGKFICELPVRVNSGLTYDVEVTWPRDAGGDIERKSITMNADRTHFILPFYRQINPPEQG